MDSSKKSIGPRQVILAAAVVMVLAGIFALQAAEKSERGYLGVTVQGLDSAQREKLAISNGVEVVSVDKESAAAKAGIKEDDIIRLVNGEKVRDTGDLLAIIGELAPGAAVKIGLWRDGKSMDVTASLGKRERREWFPRDGKKGPLHISSGGYLGVVLQELNADLAPYFSVKAGSGVLVLRVEKDTPAEKAGLKAGDVIVQMGEKTVTDAGAVQDALAGLKKGDSIAIAVVRRGKKETVKAEPDFDRHKRVIRIYRSGHGLGREELDIPELDIDIPPLPELPDFEEQLRHVHEKMDQVKVKLDKRLEQFGENFWI